MPTKNRERSLPPQVRMQSLRYCTVKVMPHHREAIETKRELWRHMQVERERKKDTERRVRRVEEKFQGEEAARNREKALKRREERAAKLKKEQAEAAAERGKQQGEAHAELEAGAEEARKIWDKNKKQRFSQPGDVEEDEDDTLARLEREEQEARMKKLGIYVDPKVEEENKRREREKHDQEEAAKARAAQLECDKEELEQDAVWRKDFEERRSLELRAAHAE